MQLEHKFLYCQQKFVDDFICFKLIISSIIKISPIDGNNNLLASWFLMNFDFLPEIAQFDKRINLFCFVLLTLLYSHNGAIVFNDILYSF